MDSILVLLEKRRSYGGAELATHLILKLLANEGFNITFATGMREFEAINGVKCLYHPLLDVPSKIHLWINLLTSRSHWLSKLIKKNDVVYIPRLAYPVVSLARKYSKRVIVHLHDYQPITYCSTLLAHHSKDYDVSMLDDMKRGLQFGILGDNGIWRTILCSLASPLNKFSRLWVREADEIICVSKRQCEIIGLSAPELTDKLRVIYNPLPRVPLVEKKLEDPTFLYLGGDSYIKGFDILLNASQKILKRGHHVKLLVTRNFRSRKTKILVERLNEVFKGTYNLLGNLCYKEVLNLHSISYALLFSSIWEEPLPYVVLEAMLSGTIPIAAKVGGVPEIVEGSFAEKMLFNPYDVNKFADEMELLLAMSKEQIVDVGYSLREATLRKFDQETTKKKLMKAFLS